MPKCLDQVEHEGPRCSDCGDKIEENEAAVCEGCVEVVDTEIEQLKEEVKNLRVLLFVSEELGKELREQRDLAVDLISEAADLFDDEDYEPDSFTSQPYRAFLTEYRRSTHRCCTCGGDGGTDVLGVKVVCPTCRGHGAVIK